MASFTYTYVHRCKSMLHHRVCIMNERFILSAITVIIERLLRVTITVFKELIVSHVFHTKTRNGFPENILARLHQQSLADSIFV